MLFGRKVMAMKKIFPSLALLVVVFAACGAESSSATDRVAVSRPQCASEHNGQDRPCQISPYRLVSVGTPADGMYVSTVLFHPGMGVKLFFVNEDAAEHEDYSSSFLVLGADAGKLPKERGFYRVIARLNNDNSDHGVGSGVYSQAGTFTELVEVRRKVAVSSRVEECRQLGCTVRYQDGINGDGGN